MAKKNKCVAESWVYITKADRALPKEQQTRFTLRPMTWAERDRAQDNLAETSRVRAEARRIALENIIAVENFPVDAPESWPKDRAEREAYLGMLDDSDVLEVGNEIFARSTLGADEAALKNSSTPERTSASGVSSADPISTTAPSAPSSPP